MHLTQLRWALASSLAQHSPICLGQAFQGAYRTLKVSRSLYGRCLWSASRFTHLEVCDLKDLRKILGWLGYGTARRYEGQDCDQGQPKEPPMERGTKRAHSPETEPSRKDNETADLDHGDKGAEVVSGPSLMNSAPKPATPAPQKVARSEVCAWLQAAVGSQQLEESLKQLDERIVDFVLADSPTLLLPALKPRQRWWVHTRGASLGLQTASGQLQPREQKNMSLTKPAGWSFNGDRRPEHIQLRDRVTQKQAKRARMDAWRTSCDVCWAELDAYGALYHWNGMGPLCELCVEEDDELSGLKWEPKCGFWCDAGPMW